MQNQDHIIQRQILTD